jgi:cbb3-type cytochrome oxidase maturation protein
VTVLYLVLPLALAIAAGAVAAFAWTVRSGQLDDVDTPPHRILYDDDGTAQAVRGDVPAPAGGARKPPLPPENRWHAA